MRISPVNLNAFKGLLVIKGYGKPNFEIETRDIVEIDTSTNKYITSIKYNDANNTLCEKVIYTPQESHKKDILIGYAAAAASKDVIIRI